MDERGQLSRVQSLGDLYELIAALFDIAPIRTIVRWAQAESHDVEFAAVMQVED